MIGTANDEEFLFGFCYVFVSVSSFTPKGLY